MQTVNMPTLEQAFKVETSTTQSTAVSGMAINTSDRYEVVQLAVRKMTGVTEPGSYDIKQREADL